MGEVEVKTPRYLEIGAPIGKSTSCMSGSGFLADATFLISYVAGDWVRYAFMWPPGFNEWRNCDEAYRTSGYRW